jgi:predicted transcriptional regulator
MPIQGIEWLLLPVFIVIIYIVLKKVYNYRESRKLDEAASRILRFVTSAGKASIADITTYIDVPLKHVYKAIHRLLEHGLVNMFEGDNGATYIIPRTSKSTINESSYKVEPATRDRLSEKSNICPRCGHGNKPGSRYCTECGSRLED